MRIRWLVRKTALVAVSGGVIFGCAAIAGLDDESGSSSGSSGTSSNEGGNAVDDVQIEPASLDFAPTDCGRESTKVLQLYNRSTKHSADYVVTSTESVFVVKKNGKGSIPPGGSADVEIGATPTLAQLQDTKLKVAINSVDRPHPAKVLGQGATFELSQTAVDFGDVRKENGGEAKITVQNKGSKALDTTLEPTAPTLDFEVTPSVISAPSDGSTELTVKLKAGASHLSPIAAQFKPKAAGICGALPVLDVRGKRITTDVTVDVVDWGDIGCKSTPADRDAVIKNYSMSSFTYTSTISGTPFAINSNGSASVSAGTETNPSTQRIRLRATPGTVPGQKDETLTITYGGGQTSAGKVRAYVVGMVLVITPATSNFTSDGGTEQSKTFNISNNGGKFGGAIGFNAGYQVTGGPGFRTANGTGSYYPAYLIFPPSTGNVDVIFKAPGPAPVTGNLVVTGPVCSQNTVTLNGTNP